MARNPAPKVATTTGTVEGAWKDKGTVAVFRGVPFAAPPVGDLRWRPPAERKPWSGTRSATRNGPTAVQRATFIEEFLDQILSNQGWHSARVRALRAALKRAPVPKESEDCLYLTVRTPEPRRGSGLPVMLWIHGGDHQDGSAIDVYYQSNALAHQGVVTVAINYRLGLLGYLAHPELSAESPHGVSGNYGTLDQVAALEWVRDNIEAFGGDPDNVTIFGESAGGESVLHMMTSPLARGLFHRALPQSPANSGQMIHSQRPFLNYESAEDRGVAFARALGFTGASQLSRLRNASVAELQALVRSAKLLGEHFPAIDGHVLPESPLQAFASGNQAPVPLLIGSTADEGSVLLPILETPMVEYRHLACEPGVMQPEMAAAFGDDIDELVRLYPGLDRGDRSANVDFLGDHMFGARAFWYARHHARASHPTWLYHFARVPPSETQTAGAYHAAELPFVHGSNVPILPLTADDKILAEAMRTYWTAFAGAANPNVIGEVDWPPFDEADPQWMRFDHRVEVEKVSRLEKYEILNRRTERLVELMAVAAQLESPQFVEDQNCPPKLT